MANPNININIAVVGIIGGCRVMCIGAKVNIPALDNDEHTSGEYGKVHFRNVVPDTYPVAVQFCTVPFPTPDITVTANESDYEIQIMLDNAKLDVSVDNESSWDPLTPDFELVQNQPAVLRLQWGTVYHNMRAYLSKVSRPQDIQDLRFAVAAPKKSAKDSKEFLPFTPTSAGRTYVYAAVAADAVAPSFQPDDQTAAGTIIPDPALAPSNVSVSMRRTASRQTNDLPLWVSIRNGTDSLSFPRYMDFMEWVFCGGKDPKLMAADFAKAGHRALPFTDTDAYKNIKFATEAFVMANCAVQHPYDADDARYLQEQVSIPLNMSPSALTHLFQTYRDDPSTPGVLPYLAMIRRKLMDEQLKRNDIGDVDISKSPLSVGKRDVTACYGILKSKLEHPCFLELIWSYWQEEGMLNQTMNAISRRFQNVRGPLPNDPLANTEIDPLRPLNNILWGYVQDEQHRLSVVRRNYEYDHHYGLRLAGKAVSNIRTADSRSRFLEAFHTLLSIVSAFYKRDDDTTIVADGFPVLNALKEAHLILSQGAHNQFGDLPSTARIEMLMQQWILARPEFREFLPTRIMVAYPEPWMDRVDAMKKLQGWSDTSVLHFRNLAIFGEQILLSVRYGAWAAVNDPWQAVNWARYWRPEIQGYLHAYRSATSVDLSVDVTNARIDAVMPSIHLVKRLTEQKHRTA